MTTAQERIDSATKKDPKQMLIAQLKRPQLLDFIRSVAPGQDPLGMVLVAFQHVQATPALAKCSTKSIVQAVLEAAKLGLTVDGLLGHAYMVPYKDIAKMMLGYRGIEQLAYRSGLVTRFHADTIHEFDVFHYAEGVEVEFRHEFKLGDRGSVIGAYATAHLAAGGPPLIAVMSLEEIHARRARSAGWKAFKADKIKSTPWDTDFEAMARKTPIRELGKRIPDPTLQGAALRDEAREEGRAIVEDPIDLGEAEVTPDEYTECAECGRTDLLDGKCPDCDPIEPTEGGA